VLAKALSLLAAVGILAPLACAQHLSSFEREQELLMLQNVAADVHKYYYDPKFRGVDWDARVEETKQKITKATSMVAANLEIAALLEALDDSNTFFVPPQDHIRQEYGWRFQMVGKRCYVSQVEPKSDADTKGVKPGDEVLTVNGLTPTGESLSRLQYVLNVLSPQPSLRVDLRDPTGKIRQVQVMAKVRQARQILDIGEPTGRDIEELIREREDQRRLMRPQYKDMGKELMILKLPGFPLAESAAQEIIDKARKHITLILDLRGNVDLRGSNPGDEEADLRDLLGSVFGSDVKIADRVARDTTTPLLAKSGHHPFAGKLIVLMDSESTSAAELFARVVQIEKRGTIMGDRKSGGVMGTKYYGHQTGANPVFFYGAVIADADLVMTDGKSLEHTGVTPDETILPTAADLANDRDPVMSRAADIAGVPLSPEVAAKLFPYEWPRK